MFNIIADIGHPAVSWAFADRLRIADVVLDAAQADSAASIREGSQASVADAHLGAVMVERCLTGMTGLGRVAWLAGTMSLVERR